MDARNAPPGRAGALESGSYLDQELRRRLEVQRAATIAEGFDEADALTVPLVLALARLAAQRDARQPIT